MFYARLQRVMDDLELTIPDVARLCGLKDSTIRSIITRKSKSAVLGVANKISKGLSVSLEYLNGDVDDWRETSTTTQSKVVSSLPEGATSVIMLPLIGTVRAGNGGLAYEDLDGFIPVSISVIHGNPDNYFCLKVKGDSMAPRLLEGDNIVVEKVESVDSGTIAVVLIDDEEGVVKRVRHSGPFVNISRPESYWIELISENPYYPPRRFVGEDVLRVRVIGKAVGSYRFL